MNIETLKEKLSKSAFPMRMVADAINILNDFTVEELQELHSNNLSEIKEQAKIEAKQIAELKASGKMPKNQPPKKTDTSTNEYNGLLKCPKCKGKLYIERICPGCKEGQKGKSRRLICENIPECDFMEAI